MRAQPAKSGPCFREFLTKYGVKTIPSAKLVNDEGTVIEAEVRNRVQVYFEYGKRKLQLLPKILLPITCTKTSWGEF